MFNVGPLELMMLLVLALIVFGPAKLPELMASAGHAIREFQRASRELTEVFQDTQQEFASAFDVDGQANTAEATSEAAEYAPDETVAEEPVSYVAPVATAPDEYETAAAMVEPVTAFSEAFEEAAPDTSAVAAAPGDSSQEPSSAPVPIAATLPEEQETAAALIEPIVPVPVGSDGSTPTEAQTEPVPAAKPRRSRRAQHHAVDAADQTSAQDGTQPAPTPNGATEIEPGANGTARPARRRRAKAGVEDAV